MFRLNLARKKTYSLGSNLWVRWQWQMQIGPNLFTHFCIWLNIGQFNGKGVNLNCLYTVHPWDVLGYIGLLILVFWKANCLSDRLTEIVFFLSKGLFDGMFWYFILRHIHVQRRVHVVSHQSDSPFHEIPNSSQKLKSIPRGWVRVEVIVCTWLHTVPSLSHESYESASLSHKILFTLNATPLKSPT